MNTKIIDKMPLYNFLNMLQVGTVFFVFIYFLNEPYFNDWFEKISTINAGNVILLSAVALMVIYETGYVLFRLGGTFIDWLLKVTRIIKVDKDYKKFAEIEKNNEKLAMLSREYAYARTQVALGLLCGILAFCYGQWIVGIVIFPILAMFVITVRKHAVKIVQIMKTSEPHISN